MIYLLGPLGFADSKVFFWIKLEDWFDWPVNHLQLASTPLGAEKAEQ